MTICCPDTYALRPDAMATYRRDGYLKTPGLLSTAEAEHFRQRFVAEGTQAQRIPGGVEKPVFLQQVNLWKEAPDLLELALHARMRQVATTLVGEPLRLWHDHLLLKRANSNVATEFHQDQPYWPHSHGDNPISAWVALCDVPVERGAMSYIPGSHCHRDLTTQDLHSSRSLFERCPELEWEPYVTVPVKAGDVIWHHGRTAHRAHGNATDQDRVVVSVIYMPQTTRYNGIAHVCTDGKSYPIGEVFSGPDFPEVTA